MGGGEPEGLAGALLHVGNGELGLDLARILGNIAVDRHHHRNALAGIEHLVAGEGALRLRVREVGIRYQQGQIDIEHADIVAGIDPHHAVEGFGSGRVDREDPGPCDRAARKRRMERAW